MKKWMSALIAVILVLSAVTAFADAAPSKTTSDLATVEEVTTSTDVQVKEDFAITVAEDTIMTVEEVEKLYEFVTTPKEDAPAENNAPIDYFEDEVKEAVLTILNENLPETEALVLDDLQDWEINEIVTVEAENYEEAYGDVTVTFSFATPYEKDQKLIALLGLFDGTRTEVEPGVYEFNAEWIPLQAEVGDAEVTVTADGQIETTYKVNVIFTQEAMEKMAKSVSSTVAILSEPTVEAPAEA